MRHLASSFLKPLINEMKHEIILETYVFHIFLKNTFQLGPELKTPKLEQLSSLWIIVTCNGS